MANFTFTLGQDIASVGDSETATLNDIAALNANDLVTGVSSSALVSYLLIDIDDPFDLTLSGYPGIAGFDSIRVANNATLRLVIGQDFYDQSRAVPNAMGVDVVETGSGAGMTLDASLLQDGTYIQLHGGQGEDTLIGGLGWHVLVSGAGDDLLIAGAGTSDADGGTGSDTLSFAGSSAGVTVDLLAGTASDGDAAGDTFLFIENLTGSDHNDGLTGDTGVNVLEGGDGNDQLDGGADADDMTGGDGNDRYILDQAGDTVTEAEGEGTDGIVASFSYTLADNFENLVLTGSAALGTGNDVRNVIVGNAAANTLSGLEGNDRLDGGAGADSLVGGDGNDAYLIDNLSDTITEGDGDGSGRDTVFVHVDDYAFANNQHVEVIVVGTGGGDIFGNNLANTMIGSAGINSFWGDDGNDRLEGRNGNDFLMGADGSDTLIGGAGGDSFAFASLEESGVDTVARFEVGVDNIVLWAELFGAGTSPSDGINPALFKANARGEATEADDRVIFSTGTGRLSFDADGSGEGAAVQLARLTGAANLSATDFILMA